MILLSPAKSLDYKSELVTERTTEPLFVEEAAELIEVMRGFSEAELQDLMGISENLAELNRERYLRWEREFTDQNSRAALLAFTGDVYQGFELEHWSTDDFYAAMKQVRILSGLYGVLRPMDRMQPYRLEMGTKLETKRGKNLYEFWGEKITRRLNEDLAEQGDSMVVNLASKEYFKSVKTELLEGELVSPVFRDEKKGTYKIISFYAKRARGMMADFIVREGVSSVEELKEFSRDGYYYDAKASEQEGEPVFLRDEQDS